MLRKYYYSNGQDRNGPFTLEELKEQDVTSSSLIWYQGLKDWKPAMEIDDLQELLEIKPPPINDELEKVNKNELNDDAERRQVSTDEFKNRVPDYGETDTPHPWRRFFARTVDLYTAGALIFVLFSFLVGLLFPDNVDGYIKLVETPLVASIAIYLLWIPFEALFLNFFGTTPAKWIFGIYIKNEISENLSYKQALRRSLHLYAEGEGLAIPLITIFTRLSAYNTLVKRNTTSWDTSVKSKVFHRDLGVGRIIINGLVVVLTFFWIMYLNSL